MPEPIPTQDEITRVTQHLLVQECERTGHAPNRQVATFGAPVGIYYCECGEIAWKPVSTDA